MPDPSHSGSFLLPILVFLAAAVLAVPLFRAAGMGAVIGYLAAGVVIGPHALGLIGERRRHRCRSPSWASCCCCSSSGSSSIPRARSPCARTWSMLGLAQMVICGDPHRRRDLAVRRRRSARRGAGGHRALVLGDGDRAADPRGARRGEQRLWPARVRDPDRRRTFSSCPSSPSCRCWRTAGAGGGDLTAEPAGVRRRHRRASRRSSSRGATRSTRSSACSPDRARAR